MKKIMKIKAFLITKKKSAGSCQENGLILGVKKYKEN